MCWLGFVEGGRRLHPNVCVLASGGLEKVGMRVEEARLEVTRFGVVAFGRREAGRVAQRENLVFQ